MTISHQLLMKEIEDYVLIAFGCVLYTFAFTFFLMPYEIVTGGVGGIAVIIQYATDFPNQYTYFLINAALLVVALKVLGFKFLMKTIYATFLISLLWGMWKEFVPRDASGEMVKILGEGQDFMSLMIGCTLTGTAMGIIFVNNGSTGGSDIVAASINKYYDLSLGTVLLLIDFVVIGSCLFIPQFGTPLHRLYMVVFGFCTMVIENFMIDYIYNKRRGSVMFIIVSQNWEELADALANDLNLGITILHGQGYHTRLDREVLFVMAHNNKSTPIFRLIKKVDPNAFVSQSSVIGVYGEGFDKIKVKVKKDLQKLKHKTPPDQQ